MKRSETLSYAAGDSLFGTLLLAAGDVGVVAIFLGDNPGDLLQQMSRRFQEARLVPGGNLEAALLDRVQAYADDASSPLGLPLDFRGTAFQNRVWDEVLRLPPRGFSTYAMIATRIGAPRAARAVGNACALNDFALVVPCHRVFHSDGTLGGTRWGLERQKQLVEHDIPGIFAGQEGPVEKLKAGLLAIHAGEAP